MNQKLWRLIFDSQDPDVASSELFEHGFSGVELTADNKLVCYQTGNPTEIAELLSKIESDNLCFVDQHEITNQDWVQYCHELLEPLKIGQILILPVANEEQAHLIKDQTLEQSRIKIIPSTGFGTGHHASTQACLELLQHAVLRRQPPGSALDFGTGSGLLALACHKLYHTKVMAIDNDEHALNNAHRNLSINPEIQQIEFKQVSIEDTPKQEYDLIMANIYQELLCFYHSEIASRLKQHGFLIVAGIMENKLMAFKQTFEVDFTILAEDKKPSWYAALLQHTP